MPIITDPGDLERKHAAVAAAIAVPTPRYAQADDVDGQMVSYHYTKGFSGFWYGHPMPHGLKHSDIMDATILEVAAGRGRASSEAFSGKFARRMIKTRRAFHRADKDAEADLIVSLMANRADLFRS